MTATGQKRPAVNRKSSRSTSQLSRPVKSAAFDRSAAAKGYTWWLKEALFFNQAWATYVLDKYVDLAPLRKISESLTAH